MTAIAVQNKTFILEELAKGKRLSDLGLPVSPQAISKILKDDPEYREAIEHGLSVRLDEAEKALESAETTPEQVDVARARARFQSVAWRAEREFPHRWGQRTQVDVNIDISSALADLSSRLSERVVSTQSAQSEPNLLIEQDSYKP